MSWTVSPFLTYKEKTRGGCPVVLDTSGWTSARSAHPRTESNFAPVVMNWANRTGFGAPLVIKAPPPTDKLKIVLLDSPDASALQWLEPNQTPSRIFLLYTNPSDHDLVVQSRISPPSG